MMMMIVMIVIMVMMVLLMMMIVMIIMVVMVIMMMMMIMMDTLPSYLEENRQHIIYVFIVYVITFGLFTEKFIYFAFMAEHRDLRHVMGIGIAFTRGAAAAMSFNYSIMLLTVSRQVIIISYFFGGFCQNVNFSGT